MQKERLRERILALERQLDQKQDLELEVEHLKRELSAMRHMEFNGGTEIVNKVETFLRDLSEKEGELAHVNKFNQDLVVRERETNDELQEARRALISVCSHRSISLLDFSLLMDFLNLIAFVEFERHEIAYWC